VHPQGIAGFEAREVLSYLLTLEFLNGAHISAQP
jgi:hypothetical protein